MIRKLSQKEQEQKVKGLAKDSLESDEIKKDLFRIKRAIETTGDAIGVTDSQGSPIYHNKALTELFGYSAEELKDAGGPTILYANQHVAKEVFETIDNGKSWNGEIVMISRTGRKFPVSLHADVIFDDAGKFIGVIGIHRDITEIKQTEEALRKSEERFRSLIELTSDWVWEVDQHGIYTYADPKVKDLLGYKPEEVIGKPYNYFMTEGSKKRLASHFEQQSDKPISFPRSNNVQLHRDGRQIMIETSGLPIFDINGKLTGWRGIDTDITKRKLAEEALSRSEKRYRLLAENVTDNIWTMDMGMHFTYVSPSVTHLRGFSVEEAMAQTIEETMTPDSYEIAVKCFREELEMYQKGGSDHERSVRLELELLCKDGSTIWAELIMKFFYSSDEDSLGVIGVTRDITEKKLLQSEAIRAGHLAALGELAAGVAHEINNPIHGVINYAEILKDESNERGEDADIPERIINEGERIAKIVRNLLSFSQDRKEHHGPVLIKDILSDTLSLVEQNILNEGIILTMNDFSDLPNVGARYQEIQQVFLNILSNARYALNHNVSLPHIDKIIKIKGEEIKVGSRDYVRTTFYDSGSGISEEIQDKICDPFFSSKPKDMGTGLGLSISHGIIKNHKGRLLFESAEGLYTKVFVDLPVWKKDQI